jgi:uncharacterized phage protein gp47/JayE
MAGLTDSGLDILRLPEILAVLRARGVNAFQDLVAPGDQVDTSDSSAIGRVIGIISEPLSDLWEVAQQVYSAFDPNSASGTALDNLVALGGLVRQQQTSSTTQMLITGDNGTVLSSGLVFGSTTSAYQWNLLPTISLTPTSATGVGVFPSTVADTTLYTLTYSTNSTTNTISYTSGVGATRDSILSGIAGVVSSSHPSLTSNVTGAGSSGVIYIRRVDEFSTVDFTSSANLAISKVIKIGEAQASVVGPVAADANTITNILTPVIGLDSVTNIISASLGRNIETDEQLRERFRNAKFQRASNIIEALYSALINLEGVEEVVIYENDTNTTDSRGVPAHSFMPILLGGIGSEIALRIWENKPMGIQSFGDTPVTIYDSQGYAHVIAYQRPDPVPIYISIDITADPNFPASGSDQIKSAIVAYFDNNQGIGDDVVYSRLYTPINSVPDFQVDSLRIGTIPTPTATSNIVINFDQLATISTSNILVNGA